MRRPPARDIFQAIVTSGRWFPRGRKDWMRKKRECSNDDPFVFVCRFIVTYWCNLLLWTPSYFIYCSTCYLVSTMYLVLATCYSVAVLDYVLAIKYRLLSTCYLLFSSRTWLCTCYYVPAICTCYYVPAIMYLLLSTWYLYRLLCTCYALRWLDLVSAIQNSYWIYTHCSSVVAI